MTAQSLRASEVHLCAPTAIANSGTMSRSGTYLRQRSFIAAGKNAAERRVSEQSGLSWPEVREKTLRIHGYTVHFQNGIQPK